MVEVPLKQQEPPRHRPPFVVGALLLATAMAAVWSALSSGWALGWLWAAVLLAAAAGVLCRQNWGRWLVFGAGLVAALSWIGEVIGRGSISSDPYMAVASFIPGALLLTLCAGLALAVRKPFRD